MLAFAQVTYFHEEQRFRNSLIWVVIAVPIAFAVLALLGTANAPIAAPISVAVVGVAVAALFWIAHLETTVTDDAVIVRFHGVWPTRTIRLDDIAEYAPMHYAMWDSGGWGVHFGLAGMTYNVSGNDGVHFRLTNGQRILVGTQRPADLVTAIRAARAARRI